MKRKREFFGNGYRKWGDRRDLPEELYITLVKANYWSEYWFSLLGYMQAGWGEVLRDN